MKKRGITLLLAVVITSAALTAGVSIYLLLFSQIEISGTEQDSLVAYYAVDSASECAIYWDKIDPTASPFQSPTSQNITCGGVQYAVESGTNDFYLSYPDAGSCARVITSETFETVDVDGQPFVITGLDIYSTGENRTNCAMVSSSGQLNEQRALFYSR